MPGHFSIQAGSTMRRGDKDANVQMRTLSRIERHSQYNRPSRFVNNIAILFWIKPLTFGANVQPIRLPTANATVPYGQNSIAPGWGYVHSAGPYADTLEVVTLPLVSNEDCNRAFPDMITADMVCAGGEAARGGKTTTNYSLRRNISLIHLKLKFEKDVKAISVAHWFITILSSVLCLSNTHALSKATRLFIHASHSSSIGSTKIPNSHESVRLM